MHALGARGRRAAEHLRIRVAQRSSGGKYAGPMQHLAAHLHPVVEERRLHLRDHRALDAEVRVAPVVRILRVARPLVGDAHAAGEPDAAVDHQELAVRAVVEPREVVPVGRMVALDLDAGVYASRSSSVSSIRLLPTQSSSTWTRTPARARSASASANVPADFAGPVDVRLEGDRALRRADRLQHGREDLSPLYKRGDAVARDDRPGRAARPSPA